MKKSSKWLTYQIPENWDKHTLEEVLKGPLLISNRMCNRLTRMKGIRLNRKVPFLKKQVRTGDVLEVAIRPVEKSELIPQPVPFTIIYEDLDLMVIDKPAGIQVHPVKESDQKTLTHGILYHWQQAGVTGVVRPVHRLDRHTSGLILIAKNAYMHQLLDRQLREKQIRRIYQALVGGLISPSEGVLNDPIGRDPFHPTKRRVTPSGQPAMTHYRTIAQAPTHTLVEIELATGRTHQIRVHFAHMGAPLLGDRLYQGDTHTMKRQALHATELLFTHPLTHAHLHFRSQLPTDMEKQIASG
ncbi:RluA family pseudouridine synthase [Hazenella sp. IB182357]|uniref:Pseudouridine synthase n=1 Tax=Polycladospora coralii TaxID=2771432 RepID=A0A926N9Z3_9BACL|nr:RluA family pseudouridine synthase [Polycladospora coralii]MBD1372518.1 RluA family pseudouridine synthase [Polycladospora coralii]MBS7531359.1 RluA family pseudouridine synthase [Polycladospora coralii]